MGEVEGLRACPSCRRGVTHAPRRGFNDPEAFHCIFCPAVVCDWCYSTHTREQHAAEALKAPDPPV